MNIGYIVAKARKRIFNKKNAVVHYLRRRGVTIGEECNINSDISTGESYLITIGNNVTISNDVIFLTHDASIGKIFGKDRISDLCGRITIGDNCFIGARSTILYGVTLSSDTIVAAGSVVTRSVKKEKTIIGGNPAKEIGSWDSFKNKGADYGYSIHGLSELEKKKIILSHKDKLIIR